jgi:hypothetical protein
MHDADIDNLAMPREPFDDVTRCGVIPDHALDCRTLRLQRTTARTCKRAHRPIPIERIRRELRQTCIDMSRDNDRSHVTTAALRWHIYSHTTRDITNDFHRDTNDTHQMPLRVKALT